MGYQVNDNIVILGDLNSDLFIANNNKLIETMMLFNLVNIISKPTRITAHSNTLLDPIIISDTMNYIYSYVLKIPSEISDHDASVAFLQCPVPDTYFFPDFTGEPRFVIISNNNCLGWNTLPCQFEKCFGKLITHVIYILKLAEKGSPVNYF
jgi:hypothetical protein